MMRTISSESRICLEYVSLCEIDGASESLIEGVVSALMPPAADLVPERAPRIP